MVWTNQSKTHQPISTFFWIAIAHLLYVVNPHRCDMLNEDNIADSIRHHYFYETA